jgi:hypothetical protein
MLTSDGLLPGWEVARVRPIPRLDAVVAGNDEPVSLFKVGMDAPDSRGGEP